MIIPENLLSKFPNLSERVSTSKLYADMTDGERMEYAQRRCDTANAAVGTLNEKDGLNCERCHNKGFVYKVVENEVNGRKDYSEVAYPCDCKPARETILRWQRSGLTNATKRYTFKLYQTQEEWQKKIKAAAIDFCRSDGGVFFIGGQSGAGKTHICTAMARQFLKDRKAVYYMLWTDEVVKLKADIMDEAYQKRMNELKTVEVLYIDDFLKPVGELRASDIRLAYELLNNRYINGGYTIISSERLIEEITDIDEATGGRIIEYSEGHMFNITPDRTKNWRLKGRGVTVL